MDEYVSKDTIIRIIGTFLENEERYEHPSTQPILLRFKKVFSLLEQMRTADAAPIVHGHIIRKHRNRGEFELLKGVDVKTGETRMFRYDGRYESYDPYCSVCGKLTGEALNYCSNCGAKMDEEGTHG